MHNNLSYFIYYSVATIILWPGFSNLRYRFNVSFTIANVTFVHFCVSPTFVRQNGPLNRALN